MTSFHKRKRKKNFAIFPIVCKIRTPQFSTHAFWSLELFSIISCFPTSCIFQGYSQSLHLSTSAWESSLQRMYVLIPNHPQGQVSLPPECLPCPSSPGRFWFLLCALIVSRACDYHITYQTPSRLRVCSLVLLPNCTFQR